MILDVAREVRELEHELLELAPAQHALEALRLPARLGRAVASEQATAYGTARDESTLRLTFIHGHESWAARLKGVLDTYLRAYEHGRLGYHPDRPERWQRNAVFRFRDLPLQGAGARLALYDIFAPLRLTPIDQMRCLVCEGGDLLAWFGVFRDAPYTDRERDAFAALTRPVRARLVLERHLDEGTRAKKTLSEVLDQLGPPAVLISASGRFEGTNRAGRALLARDREGAVAAAREAASRTTAPSQVVARARTPDGCLVLLKVNQSRAEMEARVSRVAARAGLTIRQTRVLAILAEGLSNRGIAATLGLSVRTVETHLVAVFDKLGVASRAAALAVLLEEPNHASPKMEP